MIATLQAVSQQIFRGTATTAEDVTALANQLAGWMTALINPGGQPLAMLILAKCGDSDKLAGDGDLQVMLQVPIELAPVINAPDNVVPLTQPTAPVDAAP